MWSSILYESMCIGIQNESTYFLVSPELLLFIYRSKLPIEIYRLLENYFLFLFLLLCYSECKIQSSRLKIKSLWIQNTRPEMAEEKQICFKHLKFECSSIFKQVCFSVRNHISKHFAIFWYFRNHLLICNSSHYTCKFIIFLTTLAFS